MKKEGDEFDEFKDILDEATKNNIIRADVFDIYKPITKEVLYRRDAAIRKVMSPVVQFLAGKTRKQVFIFGPVGSGKTALIQYFLGDRFQKIAPHSFEQFYVNCRWKHSTYHILQQLTGIETNQNRYKLENAFLEKLRKSPNKKKIIILDECDHIRDDNFLYKVIGQSSEEYKQVILVFITKDAGYFNSISTEVKSRMLVEYTTFDAYDKEDIYQILLRRAKQGLFKYNDTVLRIIAARIVDHYESDVRIGIKTLPLLMGETYGDEDDFDIPKEQIYTTLDRSSSEMEEQKLRAMPQQKLKIIYIIFKNGHVDNKGYWTSVTPTVEIEKMFCKSTNLTGGRFRQLISELQREGIVRREKFKTKYTTKDVFTLDLLQTTIRKLDDIAW